MEWTPEELAQIEANTMDKDVFANRLYKMLELSPPILTNQEVDIVEDELIKRNGVMRRAALIFMTFSGADLCKKIEQDREFAVMAASVRVGTSGLGNKYRDLGTLINKMGVNLMVALCSREDMEEVLAEGEASLV